jgi:Flp pilus assembly protein TadB
MSESIIVALITGGLSLVGVVITCLATSKKQEKAAAVAQAITDTKLEELTREVREHNNFALRMPTVEQEIKNLERRVDILEKYHRQPTN